MRAVQGKPSAAGGGRSETSIHGAARSSSLVYRCNKQSAEVAQPCGAEVARLSAGRRAKRASNDVTLSGEFSDEIELQNGNCHFAYHSPGQNSNMKSKL